MFARLAVMRRGFVVVPPAGPVAPPVTSGSSPTYTTYGPFKTYYKVMWINGDASAYTRIYVNGTLTVTMNPGITEWSSGLQRNAGPFTFVFKHYKNGQESAGATLGPLA